MTAEEAASVLKHHVSKKTPIEGAVLIAVSKALDDADAEIKAWRQRFPTAGFDGSIIVLSG